MVFYDESPAFRLQPEAAMKGVKPVAWYENATPLRSGWAWGQQYLDQAVSIIEAPVGKGHVVLFGNEVNWRAQPHGTFKLLFNGIYYGSATARRARGRRTSRRADPWCERERRDVRGARSASACSSGAAGRRGSRRVARAPPLAWPFLNIRGSGLRRRNDLQCVEREDEPRYEVAIARRTRAPQYSLPSLRCRFCGRKPARRPSAVGSLVGSASTLFSYPWPVTRQREHATVGASMVACGEPMMKAAQPRLTVDPDFGPGHRPSPRSAARGGAPGPQGTPTPPGPPRVEELKKEAAADIETMQVDDAADGRPGLQLRRARVPGIRDVEVPDRRFSRRTASRSSAATPAFRPRGWPPGASGKPVIALGSDIDGIPQASQKPGVGYHDPIIEGAPGHGEGHNSGVPLNITAALAVKKIMEREKLPGTLKLWPGVAEELVGAKAYFIRAGMFKDVDVSLFAHVGANLGVSWGGGFGTGLRLDRVHVQGRERARRRRAVARPLGARRRRADGRRLELPPRAPAAAAALALRHHQRRRSAERRAAERQRLVLLPRDRLPAHQGAAGDRRQDGQGRGDDDQHRGDVAHPRHRRGRST